MKFIKKFILERIKFLEPKNLDKNNALTLLINTLTPEENKGDFIHLSSLKKVQYTQAMANFQIEAMSDIGEAVIKSLTMFAIKLHKENLHEFTFEQSFYGTKENLKEELFSIKFIKVDNIEKSLQMVEYAEENSTMPRKKSETFFQQTDVILDIVEKLNGQFPMKPNNELPLRASCILLVAELMSQCNMETMEILLEGLIDGDNDLKTSYKVQSFRKEFILNVESYPPKKKLF